MIIAMEEVEQFLQFNNNNVERGLFYQAVHAALEIALDYEMELENFIEIFNKMFGEKNMDNVITTVNSELTFFGLSKTSMKPEVQLRASMQLDDYFLGRSSLPWALYKRSRRLNTLKTTTQLHFLRGIS